MKKTGQKILGAITLLWFFYSSRHQQDTLRLNEGQCWKGNVNRTGILQRINNPPLQTSYELADFLEGPGFEHANSTTDNRVACKFIKDDHTPHFPHAMQQLYRCFSWWRAFPTKDAYLILPNQQPIDTEFLKGFIERMRDVFGVRVVHMRSNLKVVRPIYTYDWDEQRSFAMRNERDAHELRNRILDRMKLPEAKKSCWNHKLRIRILSRKNSRSIQNVKAIVRALEDAFLGDDDNENASSSIEAVHVESIRVATFEEATFRKQLEFLSQADILVAAHGAELTGIPFQPQCAAVLELFPGGYAVPAFFGSLAAVSGVSHSYMYLGHGDMEREIRVGMR
ncbi:hypothetical protein MPSEU_000832700 [Mayamaea pseudoterrestris]|nr:hypothetical protein MPSEU_000832700 [Mayamaea pseudoterrestris]